MFQRKIVSVIAFAFVISATSAQAQARPGTFYCWGVDKGRSEVFLTDVFSRDMSPDEGMRELSLREGREFESFLRARGIDPSPTYCMAGGFSHYVDQLKSGFSQGRIVRSEWKPGNVPQATNLIDHPELREKFAKLTPGALLPVSKPEKSTGGGGYLVVEDKPKSGGTKTSMPTKTAKAPAKAVIKSVDKGSNKSKCHLEGKRYVCPASKQ